MSAAIDWENPSSIFSKQFQNDQDNEMGGLSLRSAIVTIRRCISLLPSVWESISHAAQRGTPYRESNMTIFDTLLYRKRQMERQDVWCLRAETDQEDTWPVTMVGSMVRYDAGVAAGVTTGRTTDSMVAPMRVPVTGESNGIS